MTTATKTAKAPVIIGYKELSELTGLGTSTLERWRREGKLPKHFHPGGSQRLVRFHLREVEAWIAAGMPDQATFEAMQKEKR